MSEEKLKQEAYDKVLKFFGGNHDKTWAWFQSDNVGIGMITPLDMIKRGRVKKLLMFIDSQLNGNFP